MSGIANPDRSDSCIPSDSVKCMETANTAAQVGGPQRSRSRPEGHGTMDLSGLIAPYQKCKSYWYLPE